MKNDPVRFLSFHLHFSADEQRDKHKIIFLNSVFLLAGLVAFGLGFIRWQSSTTMGAINFLFAGLCFALLVFLQWHRDQIELLSSVALALSFGLFFAIYLLQPANTMRLSNFFLLSAEVFFLKGRRVGRIWLGVIMLSIVTVHFLPFFHTGYPHIDILTTCLYLIVLFFIFENYEVMKETQNAKISEQQVLRAAEECIKQQLDNEKRFFQAILNNAPLGMWFLGLDGRLQFVNKTFCSAVGISEERFLSARHYVEVLPLNIGANCIRSDAECMAQEDPHLSLEWLRFVDGKDHLLEITKVKVPNQDGSIRGLVAMALDITERKQVEVALLTSLERLNEAQLLAHVGNWELDLVTKKLLWSDEVFRIFEIDQQLFSASYEAFLEAIHPQDRDQVNQAYSDSLVSHKPYEISHRLRMADGRIKWVNERCETFFDEQGRALRSVGTAQDVTTRKQMELNLRSAKEAAEALLERASIAERKIVTISEQTQEHIGQELHDDLGQHLTSAAFLSEILFRKLEAMNQTEKEDAANITRLINAAVAKTRTLAQGLYPVELKEAGLRSMVEQLSRYTETSYEVQCKVLADDDFRIDDPDISINLFRMIQEAINNAIKHGQATNIRIGMYRTPTSLVLEISDDGCGLDEPEAAPKKSGLGMHTMRYRATLIGAVLQIVSGVNGGTRVTIDLPFLKETGSNAIQRVQ